MQDKHGLNMFTCDLIHLLARANWNLPQGVIGRSFTGNKQTDRFFGQEYGDQQTSGPIIGQ